MVMPDEPQDAFPILPFDTGCFQYGPRRFRTQFFLDFPVIAAKTDLSLMDADIMEIGCCFQTEKCLGIQSFPQSDDPGKRMDLQQMMDPFRIPLIIRKNCPADCFQLDRKSVV